MDIFPMDSHFFTMEKGDALLLCSDGLLLDELLIDSNYLETLHEKSGEEIVHKVIDDAFQMGSKDNISVVYGIYEVD